MPKICSNRKGSKIKFNPLLVIITRLYIVIRGRNLEKGRKKEKERPLTEKKRKIREEVRSTHLLETVRKTQANIYAGVHFLPSDDSTFI